MKKVSLVTSLVLSVVIIISCQQNAGNVAQAGTTISNDSLISRGEYLVNAIGCGDCHAPKRMGAHGPEPDPVLGLSGHPANMPLPPVDTSASKSWVLFNMSQTATVGPWGVSFASNITSDATGIGNWTEEQFFKAMRQGKYKGLDNGRMLLPPMPWPNFARLSDTDLKSMYYYLKSTKPVKNVVPAAIPPQDVAKK